MVVLSAIADASEKDSADADADATTTTAAYSNEWLTRTTTKNFSVHAPFPRKRRRLCPSTHVRRRRYDRLRSGSRASVRVSLSVDAHAARVLRDNSPADVRVDP